MAAFIAAASPSAQALSLERLHGSRNIAAKSVLGHSLPEVLPTSSNGLFSVSSLGLAPLVVIAAGACKSRHRRSSHQLRATACLTPHVLESTYVAAALEKQCEVPGVVYAMYWKPDNGKYSVIQYHENQDVAATVEAISWFGSRQETFASRCKAMGPGQHRLIQKVHSMGKAAFISDARTISYSDRRQCFEEFGIKSICVIPFLEGVLEYGSDTIFEAPPSTASKQQTLGVSQALPQSSVNDDSGVGDMSKLYGEMFSAARAEAVTHNHVVEASYGEMFSVARAEAVTHDPVVEGTSYLQRPRFSQPQELVMPVTGTRSSDEVERAMDLVLDPLARAFCTGDELAAVAKTLSTTGRHAAAAKIYHHLRDVTIQGEVDLGRLSSEDAPAAFANSSLQLGLALKSAGMLPEAWDALLEVSTKGSEEKQKDGVVALAEVATRLVARTSDFQRNVETLQAVLDANRGTKALHLDARCDIETLLWLEKAKL